MGGWVDSESTQIYDVMNPATDEVIAQVPLLTPNEGKRAVKATKDAFGERKGLAYVLGI